MERGVAIYDARECILMTVCVRPIRKRALGFCAVALLSVLSAACAENIVPDAQGRASAGHSRHPASGDTSASVHVVGERSEGFRMPEAAKSDALLLTGVLIEGGVECPLFQANDGTQYTLMGDLKGLKIGDKVQLAGEEVEISFCMQGKTLSVKTISKVK